MPAPVFSLYRNDSTVGGGTPLDAGHALDFAGADKGRATPLQTVHVWNDKGGGAGSSTAVAPIFFALSGAGDASPIFAGTPGNGAKSMLEARSCLALNVAADAQTEWTPISPTSTLVLGDMPSNSMRTIEVRLNIPVDAADLALIQFTLRVSG